MKKLLAGFGLLMATGCTQPNEVQISSIAPNARVYVVTADCGTAACPFYGSTRAVFVTRSAEDARQRLVEVAHEMAQVNPEDSDSIIANAQRAAYGGGVHPGWAPPSALQITANVAGGAASFTLNIDTSYL